MRIVYIAGVDGSGKTTLAKNLQGVLETKGIRTKYFYARHYAFFLLPFRILARLLGLRGTDEYKDYKTYINKKQAGSRKYKTMSRLYGLLWFIDYFLVTRLRMFWYSLSNYLLIVDRYFYDVLIVISITLDLSDDDFAKLIRVASRCFPEPTQTFFLDLPEEIAFERKSDIQSVDYLVERSRKFKWLGEKLNWITLDATQRPETLVESVLEQPCVLLNNSRAV